MGWDRLLSFEIALLVMEQLGSLVPCLWHYPLPYCDICKVLLPSHLQTPWELDLFSTFTAAARVRSLVWELLSHMKLLHGMVRKKQALFKKREKTPFRLLLLCQPSDCPVWGSSLGLLTMNLHLTTSLVSHVHSG